MIQITTLSHFIPIPLKKIFWLQTKTCRNPDRAFDGFKEDGDLCSSHWIVTSTKLYIILCPPASCNAVRKVKEHYLKELNRLGKDETW